MISSPMWFCFVIRKIILYNISNIRINLVCCFLSLPWKTIYRNGRLYIIWHRFLIYRFSNPPKQNVFFMLSFACENELSTQFSKFLVINGKTSRSRNLKTFPVTIKPQSIRKCFNGWEVCETLVKENFQSNVPQRVVYTIFCTNGHKCYTVDKNLWTASKP